MLANDVTNKDELSMLVINELKDLGVKYRKDKKHKTGQEKSNQKRIFGIHLHLLELTDVILASGGIVQIPLFVSDACQKILNHVETEGLFRKAGSSLRQKEIRANLENGFNLGQNHHIIDVANVLKLFFRELPEPLLPPSLQEVLLRSLLIGDHKIEAILMTCLLLPPLTINTLAFFMQFLNTISLESHTNKMSIENLAIIFVPGLMPLTDLQGIRFNNHVKVIQLLIANSESIGVLPKNITDKLNNLSMTSTSDNKSTTEIKSKKKKKRRSGSLTRMFNGFKKIVGSALGSSENLENSTNHSLNLRTPCLIKSKKRRMIEATPGFSAKKKKELMGFLPDGGILPNTPRCTKETKKTRLSLGVRKVHKSTSTEQAGPPTVERRWSVVGSGWSRKKSNNLDKRNTIIPLSPVMSMPCITDVDLPKIEYNDFTSIIYSSKNPRNSVSNTTTNSDDHGSNKNIDSEFVRIPKKEYEAIEDRVSSLEKCISQEFGMVQSSLNLNRSNSSPSKLMDMVDVLFTGPEKVLDKFERTCEETSNMISSPTTDQLAKRLSRELKIRRNSEQRIMRSPSARKIGTIRRRSREAVRLSRNATWHNSSTKSVIPNNIYRKTTTAIEAGTINPTNGILFYPKTNLKRGRPNTVQTGLHNRQPLYPEKEQLVVNNGNDLLNKKHSENLQVSENWTAGEEFFDKNIQTNDNSNSNDSLIFMTPKTKTLRKKSTTPTTTVNSTSMNDNNLKTPMLPPKSIPRRTNNHQSKTPLNLTTKLSGKTVNNSNFSNRLLASPLDELQNGRASIARLRAVNAGMVLAKAKHFDGLGNENDRKQSNISSTIHSESNSIFKSVDNNNKRRSSRFIAKKFDNVNSSLSPYCVSSTVTSKQVLSPRKKNQTKSPAATFNQKQRQRYLVTKYPNQNIIYGDEIATKRNSSKNSINLNRNSNNGTKMDSFTPRIKKSLKVNSPRRLIRTPRNDDHLLARTPLKATPNAIRHSPRFVGKQIAL